MTTSFDALSWDDFRLVRAIAAAGTLPAAAAGLGVNHSTVFRRLRQIERAAGLALFERDRARLVPTAAGEEIVALALRIGEEVDALSLKLAGRRPEPEGDLRVTTNDSLLIHLLTPIFAAFRAACPKIRLEIVVGNPALNLSKRDADVAIRATDAPPDTLVGRKAARIAWALYAGEGGGNLDASPWVTLGESLGSMKVVKHVVASVEPERIGYRVNSVLGLAEAVEAGLGIGHLPCFIGDARQSLRRLRPPEAAFATDLWLLTHADLRHAARVRVFLDFLAAEIARRRDLIEGGEPRRSG